MQGTRLDIPFCQHIPVSDISAYAICPCAERDTHCNGHSEKNGPTQRLESWLTDTGSLQRGSLSLIVRVLWGYSCFLRPSMRSDAVEHLCDEGVDGVLVLGVHLLGVAVGYHHAAGHGTVAEE